ncbi:MAG TPA: glycoside hydrolase family 30 beta sandwich domain-containing protein [Terriglobales bacterium]|nr:glycoside hydrolase family 30 beta sandwich domain-containing protein [Terriglobales bacterium]
MRTHGLICVALLAGYSCSGGRESTTPIVSTGPSVQVVETTADGTLLLQPRPTVAFAASRSPTGAVITVNDSTKYQQIDGFGASLTDSAAWVIAHKLSSAEQTHLWQSLFDTREGIGISFLRQPMGATDFSASGNYSYDDMPPGQTDPTLANFSIAHDTAYITPLLQRALAVNPRIKIVAVPWSPPAWMKTSGTMNGGHVNPAYFPSLAQYFVKFVRQYQEQGIQIYAVLPQNEPLNSNRSYPTAYLAANDEASFIGTNLGPALQAAGFGSVKILSYDHNWKTPSYPQTVLADPAASSYVAGSAFHCYAGDVGAQSTVKSAFPNKDIWFTECSGTVATSLANDLAWDAEHLLIGATRNWARSVSLWNLALDQNSGPQNGGCTNCRGVVTIDDSASPATVGHNVEYYLLGHVARFVLPGAYRIDSNSFRHGSIEDVAFQNPDGSIALLVLNSASANRTFAVNWSGQSFQYALPAGAVATFRWKPQ